MSATWAVRFPAAEVDEAVRLWSVKDVEVCPLDVVVWLRGRTRDERLDSILRGFLSGKRFGVLPDGQLQSPQALVPQGYLPEGPWMPLRAWMRVDPPREVLGARLEPHDRLTLRLVRTSIVHAPGALLTAASTWQQYGVQAPLVRLKQWQFAVARDGRVCVRGVPLPPIHGVQLVESHGVATAAGWTWSPAVDAAVVRTILQLPEGDFAILHADGAWERIGAGDFVAATRQAIRQSFR